MFTATAFAVLGIPHCPCKLNERFTPAGGEGLPSRPGGFRVSMIGQVARVKNLSGGAVTAPTTSEKDAVWLSPEPSLAVIESLQLAVVPALLDGAVQVGVEELALSKLPLPVEPTQVADQEYVSEWPSESTATALSCTGPPEFTGLGVPFGPTEKTIVCGVT